jgi:hypothetical protein
MGPDTRLGLGVPSFKCKASLCDTNGMDDDSEAADASDGLGSASREAHPWLGQRVRLPILMICLGFAVLGLVRSRSNVLSAGGGDSKVASNACAPARLPEVMKVRLGPLAELRASLLPVMASLGGERDPGGVTTPEDIWMGSRPQRLRLSRQPGGYWPAGYEMRQWARNGSYVVADALLFAGSSQARHYLGQSANPQCHLATTQSWASQPSHALNLVSLELAGFTSYKMILARGQRVYRIVVFRPRRIGTVPSRAERSAGSAMANDLACQLAVAGCASQVQ